MKNQRQISPRPNDQHSSSTVLRENLKQRQGGVIFAGQELTDPMRKDPKKAREKLAVIQGGGDVA